MKNFLFKMILIPFLIGIWGIGITSTVKAQPSVAQRNIKLYYKFFLEDKTTTPGTYDVFVAFNDDGKGKNQYKILTEPKGIENCFEDAYTDYNYFPIKVWTPLSSPLKTSLTIYLKNKSTVLSSQTFEDILKSDESPYIIDIDEGDCVISIRNLDATLITLSEPSNGCPSMKITWPSRTN